MPNFPFTLTFARRFLPLLAATPAAMAADFEKDIRPLLSEFCLKCHSAEKQKGDVDLEQFTSPEIVSRHPKIWQAVEEQLGLGEMPPKGKPQLSAEQKARLNAWVHATLETEARAHAGDPGPVMLRRLSNSEYTYTIRDLTGVDSLDPAKEFPVDGAAGEGFTNTGNALVMSPALLTKYLEAAKGVAEHAVWLPDGFRFSPSTTRRDWTEEILAQIRGMYREFGDSGGASKVNLQGIQFDTNTGGRLGVEKYLSATLAEREALEKGTKTIASVAQAHGLNPKYLGLLWSALQGTEPSLLLDNLRAKWRGAKPAETAALASEIAEWQKALWKFSPVGQIGKTNGPKAWQEPVTPLVARQDFRVKLPPANEKDVTLYLAAGDAGDGNAGDFVVWERPRLVAPGRPEIPLRSVRELARGVEARRARVVGSAAKCLTAAAEIAAAKAPIDVAAVAQRHGVEADLLAAWLDYLSIGPTADVKIVSYLQTKIPVGKYDFIKGWGTGADTPSVIGNSSNEEVRIPGTMRPHSFAMHPSPTLNVVAGWRSPVAGTFRVEARIEHVHVACGNGVEWALELRRGGLRQRLAFGFAQGANVGKVGPLENVAVQPGDLISVLIGPRDGNHSCDLTAVDLTLSGAGKEWSLARDISPEINAGNPHADSLGNANVWHFYTEPVGANPGGIVPSGSILAQWQIAPAGEAQKQLADEVQRLLSAGPPADAKSPNAVLYRQMTTLSGPLLSSARLRAEPKPASETGETGLDPSLFGQRPNGPAVEASSLYVQAPAILEVRLPPDLADGYEFVTSGVLHGETGKQGSVQLQVATTKPAEHARVFPGAPFLANDGTEARNRLQASFETFRRLFPAALCYAKIVPVDEVITLVLFHREDEPLRRLMLDDAQTARLDRLWTELRFISQDALTLVDAYEQLWQYATQDADPKVLEPLRKPIMDGAVAFKQQLVDAEPRQLQAVIDFAALASRRPLTASESSELRALYRRLRDKELPHEAAIRMVLARVLVSPAFLYRLEKAGPEKDAIAVSDWELATRLSYFLWSSAPDAILTETAASGRLREPAVLSAQLQRMIRDPRARRLAIEFGCQWLHVRDFDTLDEKSERHFPNFVSLRGAMYEESIRFFTDFFQTNGSVLGLLDADHTFVNGALAQYYGIPGIKGDEWRRVDGIKRYDRGGILGLATTLTKQSGASRTSPILRGNWVCEVLLGEKLPRPPKGVPVLPDDESATAGLTVRQLVEKHTSDESCTRCHIRIDPFGYALERFDAIGHRRDVDLGNRPIDTQVRLGDGTQFDGLNGLREYLLTKRRDTFVRQFSRKLLGYALGRSVRLSDQPLLEDIGAKLAANDWHVGTALDLIVQSKQFREIRGRAHPIDD